MEISSSCYYWLQTATPWAVLNRVVVRVGVSDWGLGWDRMRGENAKSCYTLTRINKWGGGIC